MQLTPACVRAILGDARLSPEDAAVVARIAYIAAELDFDTDAEESETLRSIEETLRAFHADRAEPLELDPLPIDDEERIALVETLAHKLHSRVARELAYVATYVVAASNQNLARLQEQFLEELQWAMHVDDDRAADLVATVSQCMTPGLDEELGGVRV